MGNKSLESILGGNKSLESIFNSCAYLGAGTERVGYSSLVWDSLFLPVKQGVTCQALEDFGSLVGLWE